MAVLVSRAGPGSAPASAAEATTAGPEGADPGETSAAADAEEAGAVAADVEEVAAVRLLPHAHATAAAKHTANGGRQRTDDRTAGLSPCRRRASRPPPLACADARTRALRRACRRTQPLRGGSARPR